MWLRTVRWKTSRVFVVWGRRGPGRGAIVFFEVEQGWSAGSHSRSWDFEFAFVAKAFTRSFQA